MPRHFVKGNRECTGEECVFCGEMGRKRAGTLARRRRPLGRSSLALAAACERYGELRDVAVVNEVVSGGRQIANLLPANQRANPAGSASRGLCCRRRLRVALEDLVELLLLGKCHRRSRWKCGAPLNRVQQRPQMLKVPWNSEHTSSVIRFRRASGMEHRHLR